MGPMKPMMPAQGSTPTPQAKRVEVKPDHKATMKARKAKVPQRDGLAKFAKEAGKRMR